MNYKQNISKNISWIFIVRKIKKKVFLRKNKNTKKNFLMPSVDKHFLLSSFNHISLVLFFKIFFKEKEKKNNSKCLFCMYLRVCLLIRDLADLNIYTTNSFLQHSSTPLSISQ